MEIVVDAATLAMLRKCAVYWGSHGCHRPRGHEGDHWCECCECENHPDQDSGCVGRPPYYGDRTTFYGDDAQALGLPLVPGWDPWLDGTQDGTLSPTVTTAHDGPTDHGHPQ